VLEKIDRFSVVRVEDVTPAMRGIANANRREYRISLDEWEARNNPYDIVNVGQIGRKYNAVEVANLGKVAEFLGLPGAEKRFVQEDVADKGLPGQQPSLFRKRDGGAATEKPKRKVSEWSKLVAEVYKELKAKDPNVTIAMAAKEASKRRKA